jgi:hypothetical protein
MLRKLTPASPLSSRCERSSFSAPSGLARRHENAMRDSFGSDSGRISQP